MILELKSTDRVCDVLNRVLDRMSEALLIAGIVMLCVGVMRGEADTVLSKAIRLCLECVGIG